MSQRGFSSGGSRPALSSASAARGSATPTSTPRARWRSVQSRSGPQAKVAPPSSPPSARTTAPCSRR
eukprot:7706467-Pyramimonas_sp.AAC.1